LISPCYGQITDTVGTATTFWQRIDLSRSGKALCEVINDSSSTAYMLVAVTAQDTVGDQTRHQSRVNNYESILFTTNQKYVYVKVSTGTASFRIKTY
ncbi:MAG: hypothetical protein PHS34_08780, partial [Candidatus Omnitrophica bacterium]|nr:hypothetical protein [Candidatus Omnitrophota bacterium]